MPCTLSRDFAVTTSQVHQNPWLSPLRAEHHPPQSVLSVPLPSAKHSHKTLLGLGKAVLVNGVILKAYYQRPPSLRGVIAVLALRLKVASHTTVACRNPLAV